MFVSRSLFFSENRSCRGSSSVTSGSLILLTLLSKWLLYRKERKQKGEEESTEEALGLIIAGWSISFEPLGEEKKVAGPTFGRSPLFWQIFWTVASSSFPDSLQNSRFISLRWTFGICTTPNLLLWS
jgi:hypothetical protein